MRKYLLLLTMLLFAAVKVFPQTTVTIESSSQAVGSISVPINVENFNDVSAVSFVINYDESILTFNGVSDAPVAFTATASGGKINIGWFDATASQPLNLGSATLMNLQFDYIGGQTALNFDLIQSEVANSAGNPIAVNFVNGTILELGSTIELSLGTASDLTPGTSTSIDLNLTGALGFQGDVNVGAISAKISFDPSVMTFSGISNAKDAAITANVAGGVITISWFDATGSTPLVFNATQSLVATLDFAYLGGFNNVTFIQNQTEIADAAGSPYGIIFNDGGVGDVVGVSIDNVITYQQNAPVSIPVLVSDFNDIGAISIKLKYNAAVLTFTGVSNAFNNISFTTNTSLGELTLGWFDATGNTPLNIGDGTLVELNFDYGTGTSFFNFDAAQSEIANGSATILDVQYSNGTLSYVAATNATIAQIQTPTGSDDASPFAGQLVSTTGIVTAIDAIGGGVGYWLQDGSAEYSGIWVFDPTNYTSVAIGDEVTVTAVVKEFFGLTELDFSELGVSFTINSSGNALPAPLAINTGDFGEPHEGVLVSFTDAGVINPDLGFGEWSVDDGSGAARIDDQLFEFAPDTTREYAVTGVGNYSFGNYKLLPRDAADIVDLGPAVIAATITQIQTPTDSTDASPLAGRVVITTGIVTAVDTIGGGVGYWLQAGSAEYSGIWVFDPTNYASVTVGDEVTVSAIVKEYFGLTELDYSELGVSFAINSSGNPLPAPLQINTGDLGEPHEGVLVSFSNAAVVNPDLGFGEWSIDDGTGEARIDDQLYEFVPDVTSIYNVTGIGNFSFDFYKVVPRSMDDITFFDPTALASLIHTAKDFNVEVYNDGEIGDNDDLRGIGIDFMGQNGLWRGAAVWGRTSAGYINGNAHNASDFDDLVTIDSDFRMFDSAGLYDQVTQSVISDANAPSPYGLPVIVTTLSKSDQTAVTVIYAFVNNTAETISDLYGGMFLDFDVDGGTYTTNIGGYAPGERMVYVYDPVSPYFYGATALYGFDGYNVTGYSAGDETELRQLGLEYISQADADDPDADGDMRAWIGSAVPEMAPGDTSWVGFVLSAGVELIDLRENMDLAVSAARVFLDSRITPTSVDEESTIPTDFVLEQNYPNPFNPTTSIKFGLPSNSQVKLRVFNLLGETVKVITDQQMAAGYHTFNFDASNLSSGVYFYSIEASSVDGGKDFNVVKKMMLLK